MKIYNLTNLKNKRCEMHSCLRKVMQLGRWAGFFPIEGLDHSLINELRFKVRCFYSVYYIVTLVGQVAMSGVTLYVMFVNDINLVMVSNHLFYSTTLLSSLFLFRMAQHWPSMIRKAADIEHRLSKIQISRRTAIKTTLTAYIIMFLGLVEHILSLIFNFNVVMSCMEESSLTYDVIENLFFLRMSYVFDYTSFNLWKGALVEIVNVQSTFLWSFVDVMVSCVSIYITEYFIQLNKAISSPKNKTVNTWEQIRVHYSHLVELVKEIDSRISYSVLLCLFTDLFFICIQLFNTINKNNSPMLQKCDQRGLYKALHGPEHIVYFSYSFLFLVARVLILSLLTANVNSVALEPIVALGEVPASVYNIGIQRFHRQVHYTTIAISGVFFYVTRTMILNVVGTIMTYELVLIQFNTGVKSLLGATNNHTLINITAT